jgi:hypothetical protein
MNWNRSETLALAKQSCSLCNGLGQRSIRKGECTPCNCVLRAIFRACYARFRHCNDREKYISKVTLVPCDGKAQKMAFARLDEEYIADFCLIGRRTLDELEYIVFRSHFLLGAEWNLCCERLRLDRGAFFHVIYRIQQKLGRVFRELKPYGLYPVDEYFAGRVHNSLLTVVPNKRVRFPVRPPVRKAA